VKGGGYEWRPVAMNCFARDGAFYMTSYRWAHKVVKIRRNPNVAPMIEAADEYANCGP